MLDQRLSVIGTDGPDIGTRHDGHAVEIGAERPGVGAGHDRPDRAVPVLDEGLLHVAAVGLVADGPDVVGRRSRDAAQLVTVDAGAGAGHDGPSAPVPVLDQIVPYGAAGVV